MNRELVQYRADLKFPPLSPFKINLLRSVAEKYRFNPKINSKSFRFSYNGRDGERHVLKFLRETASIIGKAEGKIECETVWENDDETFEAFEIQNDSLTPAPSVY